MQKTYREMGIEYGVFGIIFGQPGTGGASCGQGKGRIDATNVIPVHDAIAVPPWLVLAKPESSSRKFSPRKMVPKSARTIGLV
jgi:hypothetical protein